MPSIRATVRTSGSILGLVLLTTALVGCHQKADGTSGPDAERASFDDGNVLDGDELGLETTTMAELIDGRLPGVTIRQMGGAISVQIRGQSSIQGGNEALIVIDGVQASGLALMSMNPADVERLEVLKGASAASYGVRGGNGVLLVTTRRNR